MCGVDGPAVGDVSLVQQLLEPGGLGDVAQPPARLCQQGELVSRQVALTSEPADDVVPPLSGGPGRWCRLHSGTSLVSTRSVPKIQRMYSASSRPSCRETRAVRRERLIRVHAGS